MEREIEVMLSHLILFANHRLFWRHSERVGLRLSRLHCSYLDHLFPSIVKHQALVRVETL